MIFMRRTPGCLLNTFVSEGTKVNEGESNLINFQPRWLAARIKAVSLCSETTWNFSNWKFDVIGLAAPRVRAKSISARHRHQAAWSFNCMQRHKVLAAHTILFPFFSGFIIRIEKLFIWKKLKKKDYLVFKCLFFSLFAGNQVMVHDRFVVRLTGVKMQCLVTIYGCRHRIPVRHATWAKVIVL